MNETPPAPPSKTLLAGRKRVVALALAAFAVVGLTGVGAIATSSTGIYNNQFIKDAVPAPDFTFTGSPFTAHYNSGSQSATETWTASNVSVTKQTAVYDGIFALTKPSGLPLALAKHLRINYKVVTAAGDLTGNGGSLATPIDLAAAVGSPGGLYLPWGYQETVVVTVTWDGTDPAPAQAIDAIADFNVTYSMNPGK